jgi:hypothetical protein
MNEMKEFLVRTWQDLVGRVGGPMTFRLILQPLVAAIIAVRSGLKDAREGRPAYFWAVFTDPDDRRRMLREGWKDVAKVFIMAVVIDFIYQLIVFRWFYPGQAVIVAVVLAIVPYLLIRGPVNRIVRRLQHSGASGYSNVRSR